MKCETRDRFSPWLYDVFPLVNILYTQLEGGVSSIIVLHDAVAYIDRIAVADMLE